MATAPKILELRSSLLTSLTRGTSLNQDQLMEKLCNGITYFCYDGKESLIFNSWYSRYEDIFLVEGKDLDDSARLRLLMRKLNPIAYNNTSYKCLQTIKGSNRDLVTYASKCLVFLRSTKSLGLRNPYEMLVSPRG